MKVVKRYLFYVYTPFYYSAFLILVSLGTVFLSLPMTCLENLYEWLGEEVTKK